MLELCAAHIPTNKKIISIGADESFDAHSVIDEITQLGHTVAIAANCECALKRERCEHLVIFPSH